MHTEAINHDPGITLINTGSQIPGRPSLGAWASYGLGSANADMPAYIVLLSQGNGKNPGQPIFSRLWGSGILPSNHQGVLMRSGKDPLLYLKDPSGLNRPTRREMLDDLAALNEGSFARFGDPEIQTRIAQYEMAFPHADRGARDCGPVGRAREHFQALRRGRASARHIRL